MLFHSTRGLAPDVDIRAVALAGLAPDGGLYLPVEWPQFAFAEIVQMKSLSYQKTALRVLSRFTGDAVPEDILTGIIDKAYGSFDDPQVTPLHRLGDSVHSVDLLKLFYGPTLAFKDVALQLMGHLFDYFLRDSAKRLTIISATSGDTGSAAMAAMAGRANIDLFVLYPEKGPSDIQRKQMTCVDAPNVHAVAVRGTFDDCQAIVKSMFADQALRDELSLTTVNSINLLRILAQMVYYFYIGSRVYRGADAAWVPSFVVPTGNFGDIYAGYAAMKCGLPIGRLVVASNSNDILTRFFASGSMSPEPVRGTLSPSMDIQVSSNFERLLFDLCDGDSAQLRGRMQDLKDKGSFAVTPAQLDKAKLVFAAGRANDDETLATIADIAHRYDYLLDPHTAVGVKVARDLAGQLNKPTICLATAHPAKFPDTVMRATGRMPILPKHVAALISKPERTSLIDVDKDAVISFIRKHKNS